MQEQYQAPVQENLPSKGSFNPKDPEAFAVRNLVQRKLFSRMTGVNEAPPGKKLSKQETELEVNWTLRYAPLFANLFLTNSDFQRAVMKEDVFRVEQLLKKNATSTQTENELH